MSVAGASRYLASATLANQRGTPAVQNTILGGGSGNALSLLDAARVDTGVGLSSRSRALTQQYLNATSSDFSQIFSLNGVEFGTTETLQQKILAIRAGLPESSIARSLRSDAPAEAEGTDSDTAVSPSTRGTTLDTQA